MAENRKEENKERSEAELRKLAQDIFAGQVYGSWQAPWIPEENIGKTPFTVIINSDPPKTPKQLEKESLLNMGRPGFKQDPQFVATLWPLLGFMDGDTAKEFYSDCYAIYSHVEELEAGRTVNGLPTFWSVHKLTKREMVFLNQCLEQIERKQRELEDEWAEDSFDPSTPEQVEMSLPATINIILGEELENNRLLKIVFIFPVQSWLPDGYTLQAGYREGVSQNKDIREGAPYACISAVFDMGEIEEEPIKAFPKRPLDCSLEQNLGEE